MHLFRRRAPAVALGFLLSIALSACGGSGSPKPGPGPDGKSPSGCTDACEADARACDGNGTKTCTKQQNGCLGWSTVTACGSGEVCNGGICRGNCLNKCGAGTSLCEGNGFRACTTAADGCLDWAPVTACTAGLVCSGGQCAGQCSDQCAEGSRQCSGNGTVVCQRLSSGCTDWTQPLACASDKVCSGGECVPHGTCADQCTAGSSRCTAGGQQQDCERAVSGCTEWSLPRNCTSGQTCTAPATSCSGGSCTEGARRCSGTSVETCNAQGAWVPTTSCPQSCANGTCTANVTCAPGGVRCNGNGVETCNSSGTAWLYSMTCTAGCTAGVCTGPCQPNAKRCNGAKPETCNAAGNAWITGTACTTTCFNGACVETDLVVDGVTVTLDGEHRFQNSVVVRNGGKLLAGSTGILKLRAQTISVDAASLISANAVSSSTEFASQSAGNPDLVTSLGFRYGSSNGGGIIDLRAQQIQVAGQITANGAATYGGGGTLLLAADSLTGTGFVQAISPYNSQYYHGVVKLLHGSTKTLTASQPTGSFTSLMPPLDVVSSTHPDPSRQYLDGAATVELAWQRPFPGVNGYYYVFTTDSSEEVSPANGTFLQAESLSIPLKDVTSARYFVIVSVDSAARVGTVRNVFPVQVQTSVSSVSSSSHPDERAWYPNTAAYLAWTPPIPATDVSGYYYVLDHYGDTVPTPTTGTFLTNSQTLLSNLAPGIWVFHLVARDSQMRTQKLAAHYILRIGTAPKTGNISGSVVDGTNGSVGLSGATITLNRGLFNSSTGASGTFTFSNNVYAGTWEATASKPGYASQTKSVTIAAGGVTNENFVLTKLP